VWFSIRLDGDCSGGRFVQERGAILISSVSPVPEAMKNSYGIRSAYSYVDVTTARRNKLTELFAGRNW
jgi:hypothetical protein